MTHDDASLRVRLGELRRAALDRAPIRGLTHCFYRYPARFSPTFAGAAIEAFSRPGDPGDAVLDPHMGGGTTIVEAVVGQRRAIGNDPDSAAVGPLDLVLGLAHVVCRLPDCDAVNAGWEPDFREPKAGT